MTDDAWRLAPHIQGAELCPRRADVVVPLDGQAEFPTATPGSRLAVSGAPWVSRVAAGPA